MDPLQQQAMFSIAQKLQEQRNKIHLNQQLDKLSSKQGADGDEEDIQDAMTDCQQSEHDKKGDESTATLYQNNSHLFESNHQNILSVLTQPKNMKEWNSLMEQLVHHKASTREEELQYLDGYNTGTQQVSIGDESPQDQITRLRMINKRRQAQNRPINGPAEWYLKTANNKGAAKLKTQIVHVLSQIESLEEELINVERNQELDSSHFLMHDLRNKRFIQSQYKLKRNRLLEEYERLTKQWKVVNNNLY